MNERIARRSLPDIQLETVVGDALASYIPDLARLRMTVFREYPYLYDGSEAYETEYLRAYTASREAIVVLARDGDAIVGASTGIPLAAENEAFLRPFEALGLDPVTVFYCGESVLLPAWRGRGIYRAFFEEREAYARGLGGMSWISFCGVVRPNNHPLRPPHWQPLEAIWRHFGFAPEPKLLTSYAWKDIDQPGSTEHPMQFWLKSLR